MQLNASVVNTVCSRPASSGRSSSSVLPRETMISCALGAEKFPYTAHCAARNLSHSCFNKWFGGHAPRVQACAEVLGANMQCKVTVELYLYAGRSAERQMVQKHDGWRR